MGLSDWEKLETEVSTRCARNVEQTELLEQDLLRKIDQAKSDQVLASLNTISDRLVKIENRLTALEPDPEE